jgi:hypothetical protein
MQASRVYYALAALLLCLASAAPLAAAQAASASPAAAPAATPGMQHGMAGMPGMQHGMAGAAADDSMPKPPCVVRGCVWLRVRSKHMTNVSTPLEAATL